MHDGYVEQDPHVSVGNPRRLVPGSLSGRSVLLVALLSFLIMRWAEAVDRVPAWAAARVDDVLIMPLLLAAILASHRLAGRPAGWILPLSHSMPVLAGYALFFEVVLPRLDARATADGLDVAAYAAGWLVFQFLLNVPGTGAATCDPGVSVRS